MSGQPSRVDPPDTDLEWTHRFMLVCDEWSPTRGGISKFNRSLAMALAATGQATCCLVESATALEKLDAKAAGVDLVTAERTPAGPNLFVCTDTVLQQHPTVVIGHDIVSGAAAWTWAKRYLDNAQLVHIVHTPSHIERYKRDLDATRRTEERERITREVAADAHIVAAVGPSLTRGATAIVGGGVRVLQLDPGMDVPDVGLQRSVPPSPTVLIFGRGAHIQPKGLDIAALAVAGLTVPHGRPKPDLFVRGISPDRCDALRSELVAASGLARGQIDVRPHTEDSDQLAHDLTRAMLCVLPSRAEGFGLAAIEAIAQGTPVLVSDRSGIAETLREHLGRSAEPMIVKVTDNLVVDVAAWTSAMQQVLDDPDELFQYAFTVRAKLSGALRWDTLVNTLSSRLAIPTQRRLATC